MVKGKNASYQHFLLFPDCLQKASFTEMLKDRSVWLIKQQNFTLVQTESTCKQQNNVIKKSELVFGREENILGKGENAGY